MKLYIDNLDGLGPKDYTAWIDASRPPKLTQQRKQLELSLVADTSGFIVPAVKARITVGRTNGGDVFTGYLLQKPKYELLGWGQGAPVYRYDLIVQSDEALLDEKRLGDRSPFVERTAGDVLRQVTQGLMPGVFDLSGVQDLDLVFDYVPDPQKKWSEHAAQIATLARSAFRMIDGSLIFTPIGTNAYTLNEGDSSFNPDGLDLQPVDALINDVTVVGEVEPQPYVKDYFVGDGLSTRFYLSQTPFVKSSTTVFNEEYTADPLSSTLWNVTDPARAISVINGELQVNGGTGRDGETVVEFAEKIQLGGAYVIQHGSFEFGAASSAVIGGLYAASISTAGCLAGFQIVPAAAASSIQAIVNGLTTGPVVTTLTGHYYVFTTRLYSTELYRRQQIFHSSVHAAGSPLGGAAMPADVRVVLQIQDIDPANPANQATPATVLYDGMVSAAPDFCSYAPVNATNLHCSVSFTRLVQAVDCEVRSALPGQSDATRLVGSLADGAECNVTTGGELHFYSPYVPASGQTIEVDYRAPGRAIARVTNPASIATQARGSDDGVHAAVLHLNEPLARTSLDCENAALAIFDDSTGSAWRGTYETWSDFLPSGTWDIFPGDALNVNCPSRNAVFQAIVRDVEITMIDLAEDHFLYKITFANDAAERLALDAETSRLQNLPAVIEQNANDVGPLFLPALTDAEVTAVSSTAITVDAGSLPASGGGIEVRWSDLGWGPGNDRNLLGRYSTRVFSISRFSQIQDCYLRQYDGSTPPRYSRYTTALHVDYPL